MKSRLVSFDTRQHFSMGITMCLYVWHLTVGTSPFQGPAVPFMYNTNTFFIFYVS